MIRARHAAQIRAGIEGARSGGYWGIAWLLNGKKSRLTKRAFVRTRRRTGSEAA